MSDKKEDHGGHGEKKGLIKTLVGIAVGIIALLIFFVFTDATVPEVVRAAANTIADTGAALSQFGSGERVAATGIRQTKSGFLEMAVEVFGIVLLGVLFAFLIIFVLEVFGNWRKGNAHPPGP